MGARSLWMASLVLGATACAEDGAPRAEAATAEAAADTVAMATALYDPAAFDTIRWDAPETALERGAVVFSYSCAKCHGLQGYGDGMFVLKGDTLRPPSFHQSSWRFDDDTAGLRQVVFVGGTGGMPHWGIVGLKQRDIDAVTRFILDLRQQHEGD